MVKTTRRERFTGRPLIFPKMIDSLSFGGNQASKSFKTSRGTRRRGRPPPEKCAANACANEPKPPRVTPPERDSDEVPDAERLEIAAEEIAARRRAAGARKNKNPAICGGVQSGRFGLESRG
jgi:hypothetical protein